MPTIEELISLCDYDEERHEYRSKSGDDYIDALSHVFALNNQNDKPFTRYEITQQPTLEHFKSKFAGVGDFKFACTLQAEPMIIKNNRRTNERIIAANINDKQAQALFERSLGVSYLITCSIQDKEHIIKIGQTRTTFRKRLQSYNCGCVNNWRTASTTNIKILQSMLATRLCFNLYLCDCSDDPYILEWHGVRSVPFASPKSLAVEDIMMKKFMEIYHEKPLANIQADATTVNN